MPWTAADAQEHTHKASTEALRALWAKVANEALARGDPEAVAIRKANAAVASQSAEGAKREGDSPSKVNKARGGRWV